MIEDSNKLVGKVLGSYKLKELISQGGNAFVFRTWQENLSRDVAVKVLRLQGFVGTNLHNNFLARFQQEASVIAAFDHVHILSIYDFGEQDGLAYLVMPLFRKGSLRYILQQRGQRRSVSGWMIRSACFQDRTFLARNTRSTRSVFR